eukprot:scaffold586578_cov48-Prasinocladus_malaysianus.AAC.1
METPLSGRPTTERFLEAVISAVEAEEAAGNYDDEDAAVAKPLWKKVTSRGRGDGASSSTDETASYSLPPPWQTSTRAEWITDTAREDIQPHHPLGVDANSGKPQEENLAVQPRGEAA